MWSHISRASVLVILLVYSDMRSSRQFAELNNILASYSVYFSNVFKQYHYRHRYTINTILDVSNDVQHQPILPTG
ncbi:hypothetical protein BDV35DRAFT_367025 [Aspergillus flavus]|uniref:Secreted protein n=1 Tax=Aspergillus flavus TaxID=5059 RepID=A0A5N6GJI3_ASPFL|nr:hypothetical protein BDV35DRAFT_367025 [Aspergillus flavus]